MLIWRLRASASTYSICFIVTLSVAKDGELAGAVEVESSLYALWPLPGAPRFSRSEWRHACPRLRLDRMEARVDPVAAECDARHREIARRLRRDPSIAAAARETLERWLARSGELSVLLEWRAALMTLTDHELADFLESTTPRARRMRTSSPFLK